MSANNKIMAIYVDHTGKYFGFGSKLYFNDKCIYEFEKSVKQIKSYKDFIGCCSYDGTCVILKNNKVFEIIEGPDTEIKGIDFYKNYMALAIRNGSVWILKNFEIFKILEYHNQDVKGVLFYQDYLISYSFDKSIKIILLENFKLERTIKCVDVVLNVMVINNILIAVLQNGCVEIYDTNNDYMLIHTLKLSLFPILSSWSDKNFFFICNRNVLIEMDSKTLEILYEIELSKKDIVLSGCCFNNECFFGTDDGVLGNYKIK
ncbi:hypothetical protein HERIO_344 [Hepatospora eriocheir]|uniref:Uncharacterized protein n=1 Tax=Hepatospora eriocheir TaxID=1081669 RepID=A0A1X0QDF5_9MICR|nr:hypothetical protein HERIO_344 [Hepatospora eriocheir]